MRTSPHGWYDDCWWISDTPCIPPQKQREVLVKKHPADRCCFRRGPLSHTASPVHLAGPVVSPSMTTGVFRARLRICSAMSVSQALKASWSSRERSCSRTPAQKAPQASVIRLSSSKSWRSSSVTALWMARMLYRAKPGRLSAMPVHGESVRINDLNRVVARSAFSSPGSEAVFAWHG